MTFTLSPTDGGGDKPRPKRANGMTISEMVYSVMLNKGYQSATGIKQHILFQFQENVLLPSIASCLSKLCLQERIERSHKGLYKIKEEEGLF